MLEYTRNCFLLFFDFQDRYMLANECMNHVMLRNNFVQERTFYRTLKHVSITGKLMIMTIIYSFPSRRKVNGKTKE